MNIVDIIFDETKNNLSKVAIVDCDREITYAKLVKDVESLKKELSTLGIHGHKKIGLFLEDSIEYIVISLAVLSCEGVMVPISPSLAWDEAESVIKKIDVDFLISGREVEFLDSSKAEQLSCGGRKFFVYQRKTESELPKEFCDTNPAFIRFSSGTTGVSKGVVISHESIYERTNAANKGLGVTSDDNIVWVLSMSYHFVVTIILFLRKVATIILCEKDFPSVMIEAFDKHKCTFMYASPFHYRIMMNSADVDREHLSNLRMAISTAVGFTEKESSRFFDIFGIEISEAYGIIEVGLPFVNTRRDRKSRGSVGRVLPDYRVQIKDKNDEGVGEVCVKGKGMFDAYYSPWQARDQVLDGGWFNTGDLGFLDNEDSLFIKGREKNVINYAGMKIFPVEVEGVLNSHPDVKESFVYGVAHDIYGQLPQADVVLKKESDKDLARELRRFCYDNVAAHKAPKEIRIVKEIKKTESGKILRT
ncbi:MAG: long-chain fatty acid--CoA ligase [Candidatus Aceula meridiana]|nr:long-chain fatty acid--CoA ligase [Candidatus Aceula meridiana]